MNVSATNLPVPEPTVTEETKPFWEATAQGKLLLKRCDTCQSFIWYPRGICPACGSLKTSWVEASGKGTIYTFTVNHRGDGAYRGAAPYVLAYVELEEGPRVLTNIVGADPETLEIGQSVKVVFEDTGAGSALPRYTPDETR